MASQSHINLLTHSTATSFLYSILKNGLKSAKKLGNNTGNHHIGTGGEDINFIYFSPINQVIEETFQRTRIYLKFEETLSYFPKYFINTINGFGPLNGQINKRRGTCNYTFRSNELLEIKEYSLPSKGPCYINDIEDMKSRLNMMYNGMIDENYLDSDDSGPEVGILIDIIEPEVLYTLIDTIVIPEKLTKYDLSVYNKINITEDEFYEYIHELSQKYGFKVIKYTKKTGGNKRTLKSRNVRKSRKSRKFKKINKSR